MRRPTPGALFVVDAKKERIAVAEANKLGIPVVAIVDTNADPDLITVPIPGNDDAIRAVSLVTQAIADVIAEARDRRRGLIAAWPLHDPLLADVVRDRLTAHGIDTHIQAQRVRSLFWIFGSYMPMHVLVPEDRAAEAAKLCRELFE